MRYLELKNKSSGFTLIEVLVAILLVVIIFTGIIGAFQLTIKVVFQSKARITALSLASERIEQIRNLPYSNIGTVGGIPSGVIPQIETRNLNELTYTIATTILNIDDAFDGKAPTDTVPADYKRVKVKVSWPGMIGGEAMLLTDITPKGLETTLGGGTISLFVQNASGLGVGQANVRIVNNNIVPPVDSTYLTDDYGYLVLPGAPTSTESYQVTVTKTGYSSERTYSKSEIANPNKPPLSVYTGSLTEPSFSIDQVSTLNVETKAQESFDDDFNSFDKTSDHVGVALGSSQVSLAKNGSQYVPSGYLISNTVAPSDLVNWDSLSFVDSETDAAKIKYYMYFATGTVWALIPDSVLPSNSSGFNGSPIDLSSLDVATYTSIRIWADFSTADPNTSPTLDQWHIYYNTPFISSIPLHIRGAKKLGTNSSGQPVYKFDQNTVTNSNGKLFFTSQEWDSYTFSAINGGGINLLRIYPKNPVDLAPNVSITAKLYYQAENSLLATVLDASTSAPIFGAQLHLFNNNLGYSMVLPSDKNGKGYFLPLTAATYSLDIEVYGYASSSVLASVSGETLKTIYLNHQ